MSARRSSRLGCVLASAATLALVVVGCGGGSDQSSSQAASGGSSPAKLQTVKLGVVREISEVFLWNIGQFAKKYGIKPEFVEAGSYPEQLQAIGKGDTDAGVIGIPQISTIADQGPDTVKVVAGYVLGGQGLVLRNGVNASQWPDLYGKTIGAPLSTGTGIMLQIAMKEAGADRSKVKLTQSGFTGTAELQALESGQWDGLGFWSPVTDQAVAEGKAHYVAAGPLDMNSTSAGPANGVLAAGPKLLGDRKLMVNFLKAFTESLDYTRTHPDQWVQLATQLTSVKPDVVKEALKHQALDYDIDVHAAQVVAKYGPTFGFAKHDASAKIKSAIDASYLAAATGKSESQLTQPVKMPGAG